MIRTLPLSFLLCLCLAAQTTSGSLAGAGYRTPPNAIEAAPGQVLIVSIHGVKARIDAPVLGTFSASIGLPNTLAGISVQLIQASGRTPVGLYGVNQTPCIAIGGACSPVTNFTLIIPFQLLESVAANTYAGLEFKEGSNVVAVVPIRAVSDKAHVITSCDESLIYYSVFGGEYLTNCTAAVVRPHGGLIQPARPVSSGEPLVAFAYGMGDVNPSPVGGPVFNPGLTKQPFVMRYAIAGGPVYWAQVPEGISLATASGTYEIHFTVPPLPDNQPLPVCGERGLYGNMTVTISGLHSSDTFELCVAP